MNGLVGEHCFGKSWWEGGERLSLASVSATAEGTRNIQWGYSSAGERLHGMRGPGFESPYLHQQPATGIYFWLRSTMDSGGFRYPKSRFDLASYNEQALTSRVQGFFVRQRVVRKQHGPTLNGPARRRCFERREVDQLPQRSKKSIKSLTWTSPSLLKSGQTSYRHVLSSIVAKRS